MTSAKQIFKVNALCSFVVVGGGATSCEFATELSDFLRSDVAKWYPDLAPRAKITLVEASPRILGSFDAALVDYYTRHMISRGIDLRLGTAIKAVARSESGSGTNAALLGDGSEVPFGTLVWSAGLAQVTWPLPSRALIQNLKRTD
jgi:NADH dehydrogenase FAD-containing subunit